MLAGLDTTNNVLFRPLSAIGISEIQFERQRRGRGGVRVPDQLGAWVSGLFRARRCETLVILLTGGTKQRQQRDIEQAKALWVDYKRRRKPPAR
jgi:hypothetical protein